MSKRYSLTRVWVLHQGEGPQRPQCVKGKGLKDPGVEAPLHLAQSLGHARVRARGVVSAPTNVNIIVSSLNDDITHATDVMIVGKRVSVCLSVDLVVVCRLPNVAPSAPCRRAVKVSRSKPSSLKTFVSSTSIITLDHI